ncbi:hypothetical protein Tco_0622065 [Tanacetum coccineum]
MDDPNITVEEYIRLAEEKARRHGKVDNWETATYGRIWNDDEVHNLISVETEFPTIVFDDTFTSQVALSCESTVSPLNDNEIDIRISFEESDDEDYMVIFDKNSFSYKIIYVDDLKTDSEHDNDKVNMPSFLSPEPTVSYFDDLDYLKDFENEFLAIVYNNALTSKLDFLFEPSTNPQHIDKYNEISFSEYMSLPPRDRRRQYLRFKGLEYIDADITDFEERLAWRRLFKVRGPLVHELILEFFSMFRFGEGVLDLDTAGALQFQLGGVRRRMSWREFILGISSAGDFLGTTQSYTLIRDLMLTLCHMLIACSVVGRSQAPKKVTVTDLFYLRGMYVGSVNIPYILTRYLRMFASRRKREEMISGGQFVARLAKHFELLTKHRLQGLTIIVATAGAPNVAEGAHDVDEGVQAVPEPVRGGCAWDAKSTGLAKRDDGSGWGHVHQISRYADFQIPYVRRTRRGTDDASTSAPLQPDP